MSQALQRFEEYMISLKDDAVAERIRVEERLSVLESMVSTLRQFRMQDEKMKQGEGGV